MIHKDAIYNNIDNILKNCLILFGKGCDDGEKGLREKATFELNHKQRTFCAIIRQSFGHIPVITLCLMGPNSPLIAYNNGDGLFNGFSLSAGGMMLSFVNSRCWRNTAKGKGSAS